MYKIVCFGKRWDSGNFKTRHNARNKLRRMLGTDSYKFLGFSIRKV